MDEVKTPTIRCELRKLVGSTPAAMTRCQVRSSRSLMMLAEAKKEAAVKDELEKKSKSVYMTLLDLTTHPNKIPDTIEVFE